MHAFHQPDAGRAAESIRQFLEALAAAAAESHQVQDATTFGEQPARAPNWSRSTVAEATDGQATVHVQHDSNVTPEHLRMLIPYGGMATGILIACTAIVAGTLRSMSRTKAFEQSRREISAYVAEGTMSPEDGERLLRVQTFSSSTEQRVARACPKV